MPRRAGMVSELAGRDPENPTSNSRLLVRSARAEAGIVGTENFTTVHEHGKNQAARRTV